MSNIGEETREAMPGVLEPLLKEVAEGTPNIAVRYGCELVDFAQDATGITGVSPSPDGSEETIRGTYLVGCDGGSSTVRKKLGIKLEGQGGIQDVCQVIFGSRDLYRQDPDWQRQALQLCAPKCFSPCRSGLPHGIHPSH